MKRFLVFIALIVSSLAGIVHANFLPGMEFKAGYFIFSNSTLQSVYHGGFSVQGSYSHPISRWLALYGSIGYIGAQGKSLNDDQKTSLWQLPVDAGLQSLILMTERMQGYVACGPRYFYVHQHNDSTYVRENLHQSAIGFFVNANFQVITHKRWLLGIFGEYCYEKASFTPSLANVYGQTVNVGGFTIGGSIAYVF